jgi:hypothetical protein
MIGAIIGGAGIAWRFFKSPLGLGLVALVAFAVLLFAVDRRGYVRGEKAEKVAQAKREEAARREVKKIDAATGRVGEVIGKKTDAAIATERVVTKTIIEKVPVYVTVASDAQCRVPLGFVRLHDAAATGVLPGASYPAGQSADTASGVALSTVGSTVVGNYGACREAFRQLDGWQEWWRGVEAIWPKKPPEAVASAPK